MNEVHVTTAKVVLISLVSGAMVALLGSVEHSKLQPMISKG